MKKIRVFFLFFVILMITGCFSNHMKLKNVEQKALDYMKEKYNTNFTVISSYFDETGLLDENRYTDITVILDDNIIVKCVYDDILEKTYSFYDNYQTDKIIGDFKNQLFYPTIEKLGDVHYMAKKYINGFDYEYFVCNEIDVILTQFGSYSSFFNPIYSNDIKSFLREKGISINLFCSNTKVPIDELYIIVDDENSWQEKFDIISELLNSSDDCCSSFSRILAVSNELYQERISYGYTTRNYDDYINLSNEGCYAVKEKCGLTKPPIVQNRIELQPGIYISPNENIDLQAEDVSLRKVANTDFIQEKMDLATDYSKAKKRYKINSVTDAYEFVFSDRFKEQYSDDIEICIDFNPEVNNISPDNDLYYYRYYNDDRPSVSWSSNYNINHGQHYKTGCIDIPTNSTIYNYYFWVGKEEVIQETK